VFVSEGVLSTETFYLSVLANDNYVMYTKKTDQPMTEGRLSLPNQSDKSKGDLSEQGKLTRRETLT